MFDLNNLTFNSKNYGLWTLNIKELQNSNLLLELLGFYLKINPRSKWLSLDPAGVIISLALCALSLLQVVYWKFLQVVGKNSAKLHKMLQF